MRVADFLAADAAALVAMLARDDAQRFRRNEPQQLRAWTATLACLRAALDGWAEAAGWELLLEFSLVRLGRRIDAVLATPAAILVLEFKAGATEFAAADRRQVEDYALDLQDFHAGSRAHPIVPILVATQAAPAPTHWPLLLGGTVAPVLDASAATLPGLLRALWQRLPSPSASLDTAGWAEAPYRPVPGIVDAACALYARHGVAEIASARADARNLTATTSAILGQVAAMRAGGGYCAIFVTGIPGAGKTLCGLNAVFGAGTDAAVFLTGNPTLVHVLREALARDQAQGDRARLRAARQRTEAAIQALPGFRDGYVTAPDAPVDHVIVIDEGQRAWSAAHAIRKSRDRRVQLTDSEPGHLLDIMRRHGDWAVVVCLVGGGQEIHDGEGGLAEWGAALAARPDWRALAAPSALRGADPRQVLPALPGLALDGALHLDVPVRSIRNQAAAPWVDALLAGDAATARGIAAAHGELPFLLTRDLADLRRHLRIATRGLRRCGLVASSGAKRLRADGIGTELPHMDAGAVARWFLDRWPDVRASDALETVATEFSCQGLELDHVGLCWGGDLVRGRAGWQPREFSGTRWQIARQAEAIANRINTYRVLLTRARYETVIWIPRGAADDATRPPTEADAIADFLRSCGVPDLSPPAAEERVSSPQGTLI